MVKRTKKSRKTSRKAKVAREKRVVKVPRAKDYKYVVELALTMDNPYNKKYIKDIVLAALGYYTGSSSELKKAMVRAVDLD